MFSAEPSSNLNESGSVPASLIELICSFFQLQHSRLNTNTLKIMQVLLNSRLIGFKEMIELGVLQNTEKLTSSMIKNRQESSLELMLEILHEILSHLNSVVRTDED